MLFRELTEQEFVEFAYNHPQFSHYQTPEEAELKTVAGWQGSYVGVIDEDKIIAAAFIMAKKIPFFNKYIYESPRGPLMDYHNKELVNFFAKNLKKYLKKHRGIYLMADPYYPYQERDGEGNVLSNSFKNQDCVDNLISAGFKHTGFITGYKNIQPRFISIINTKDKTYDELFASFSSKRRPQIHQSYKYGLHSEEIKKEELKDFVRMEKETGEKRGFKTRPLEYYEKMWDVFYPKYMKIVKTKMDMNMAISYMEDSISQVKQDAQKKIDRLKDNQDDRLEAIIKQRDNDLEPLYNKLNNLNNLKDKYGDDPVVAIIQYMITPKEIISLASTSNDEFAKYNVSASSFDWGIRYAVENKKERFNFYGISGIFSNEDPQYGVYKMKKEFGSSVEELIGEFHLIVSPLWYLASNIALRIRG